MADPPPRKISTAEANPPRAFALPATTGTGTPTLSQNTATLPSAEAHLGHGVCGLFGGGASPLGKHFRAVGEREFRRQLVWREPVHFCQIVRGTERAAHRLGHEIDVQRVVALGI